ncbi:DUF4402 domain-containing protein [Sphingomonas piscis]|uniref:DUF4402 domain-containing protein n=1 Tax=Sphingomonas piscis TaxID=2714943 RepID=A0A6G7YN06_9SPHN|nr:DUF4402 domain-containing protein [Sphingomonas piscis]QIK78121.1 DUF4402 domain-containing protein [Sphingomonas piscis]
MTASWRKSSAVAALLVAACCAVPAAAATTTAAVAASVNKPLVISRVADLSFGTILLSAATNFTASVSIGQNGVFTCPATLTCTGATSPATYNVQGSKQSPVQINVPPSMTLTGPYGTITMTTSAPSSLVLANSGFPGTDFNIGGTLTLTNATPDGLYTGTFAVTADYQ